MPRIENHVEIEVPLASAYAALTTQEGVRGWWNRRCTISGKVGGESTYHFTKGGDDVRMRFRNVELDPEGTVAWECVANDNASWVGTTVRWKLREAGGGVSVDFVHEGWANDLADTEGFQMVAGGWQHFMGSLRAYLESGTGQPFE
jgi:uncharacterized protein YndB with AHSA1/START domain